MPDLTDKQLLAIEHLLNGDSVTATSEAVEVSRQTLHEWKRQPVFQHELELQRADRQATFRERWYKMSEKVSDVVEGALDASRAETRLKAASLWLKHQALTPEPMSPLDATLTEMKHDRER